jgi:transposase
MGRSKAEEFRKVAVSILLSDGIMDQRDADDLNVGMFKLNNWITAHRDTNVISNKDFHFACGSDRLRRQNPLLREDREIRKEVT